jgi:hypothetical protein
VGAGYFYVIRHESHAAALVVCGCVAVRLPATPVPAVYPWGISLERAPSDNLVCWVGFGPGLGFRFLVIARCIETWKTHLSSSGLHGSMVRAVLLRAYPISLRYQRSSFWSSIVALLSGLRLRMLWWLDSHYSCPSTALLVRRLEHAG